MIERCPVCYPKTCGCGPMRKALVGIDMSGIRFGKNPPRLKIIVRGAKVQDFIGGAWRYPKHRRPRSWRDNSVSIIRDMMQRKNVLSKKDKVWWDVFLGKVYLYSRGKINGII